MPKTPAVRVLLPVLTILLFTPPPAANAEIQGVETRLPKVEIQVAPRAGAEVGGALVVATSVAPDGSPTERRVRLKPGTLRTELELAPDRPWRVRLEGQGVWAPEVRELDPAAVDLVTLRAWPAGEVAAPVRLPDGEPEIGGLHLYFRAAGEDGGDDPALRRGASHCRLVIAESEGAEVRCPLPAGTWNLILRAAPFMPVHRWEVEMETDGERRLEAVRLLRGASLFGQVVTAGGAADPRTAEVRARPLAGAAGPPVEVPVNDWGYFLFQGLTPGTWAVTAEQPGYAPAEVSPVRVVADRETALTEPLVLRPPVVLPVHVSPPRDPHGEPWTLTVQAENRLSHVLEEVASGTTDPHGDWRSPRLGEGTYRLRVEDSRGNPVWTGERLTVDPEMTAVWIDIPQVSVKGRVLLGDDAVVGAALTFGGRSGDVRVRTTADDEGRFTTTLPREGTWPLAVEDGEPAVHATGLEVEVEDRPGGADSLEIRLPDTRIEGTVVDPSGHPAPEAVVRVLQAERGTFTGTRVDEDGAFLLRGMAPGEYWVTAEWGPLSSETVTVPLREEQALPLTLELRSVTRVTGRLVSDTGGVAGTPLIVIGRGGGGPGDGGPGLSLMPVQAATDGTGSFVLELPADVATASFLALPVGHGFTVRTVEAASPLVVPVAAADGTLTLAGGWRPAGGEVALVEVDGEMVDPQVLLRWAHMNGAALPGDAGTEVGADRLVIPAMPAGVYRLCRVSLAEAPQVLLGLALPTRCRQGLLQRGGELTLRAAGDGPREAPRR